MITQRREDREISRVPPVSEREEKVDAMWSADEDDRRIAIARRAAAGARKALAARQ